MISAIIEIFGGQTQAGEARRNAVFDKIKELKKMTAEERLVVLDSIRNELQTSIFLKHSPVLYEHISRLYFDSQATMRTAIEINIILDRISKNIETVNTSEALLYINDILPAIRSLRSSKRESMISETKYILEQLKTQDLGRLEQEFGNIYLVPARLRSTALKAVLVNFGASPFRIVKERSLLRFGSAIARLIEDLVLLDDIDIALADLRLLGPRGDRKVSDWLQLKQHVSNSLLNEIDKNDTVRRADLLFWEVAAEQAAQLDNILLNSVDIPLPRQREVIMRLDEQISIYTFAEHHPPIRAKIALLREAYRLSEVSITNVQKLYADLVRLPVSDFKGIRSAYNTLNECLKKLHPNDQTEFQDTSRRIEQDAREQELHTIRKALEPVNQTRLSERAEAISFAEHVLSNSAFWATDLALLNIIDESKSLFISQKTLWKSLSDAVQDVSRSSYTNFQNVDLMANLFVLESKISLSGLTREDQNDLKDEIVFVGSTVATQPSSKSSKKISLKDFTHYSTYCIGGAGGTQFRPQQYQFALACFEALSTRRDLVVEGPTGLGKTRGLLAGVLPWLAANANRRILYITRTGTQVANIVREIRDVKESGGSELDWLTATLHGGIERIRVGASCYRGDSPKDQMRCSNCAFAKSRWISKADFLPDSFVLDFDYLKLVSRKENVCANSLVLAATRTARIVAAPHSFVSDEGWKATFGLSGSDDRVVLVDEGHNFIADASGKAFLTINWDQEGNESEGTATDLKNKIYNLGQMATIEVPGKLPGQDSGDKITGKHFQDFLGAFRQFADLISAIDSDIQRFVRLHCQRDPSKNEYLIEDVTDLSSRIVHALRSSRVDKWSTLFDGRIGSTMDFLENNAPWAASRVATYISSYTSLVHRLNIIVSSPFDFYAVGSDHGIEFYSIPPKHEVSQSLRGFASRVFTSATIRPVRMLAEIAGLQQPLSVEIPHVFPHQNYRTFYVVGFHSGERITNGISEETLSQKQKVRLRGILSAALRAAQGRNVGIFSNNARNIPAVQAIVRELLSENDIVLGHLPGRNLLSAARTTQNAFNREFARARRLLGEEMDTDGKAESRPPQDVEVAELFIKIGLSGIEPKRTVAIIGVQGGTLAEGIDYRGDAMEMVINIGLPYPVAQDDQIKEIREKYWTDAYDGNRSIAQDLAFRQDAFRKLAQTVGRAHRTPEDRAVVIFVDERLLAIKEEDGHYNQLTTNSVIRNRNILQDPVQSIRSRIVVAIEDSERRSFVEKILIETWASSVGLDASDFLGLDEMSKQISAFYDR